MSILPSFLQELSDTKTIKEDDSQVVKMPREYGVDFQTGQLTGKIVEGIEAIKVWIWLCLHTERFRHADTICRLWYKLRAVYRSYA